MTKVKVINSCSLHFTHKYFLSFSSFSLILVFSSASHSPSFSSIFFSFPHFFPSTFLSLIFLPPLSLSLIIFCLFHCALLCVAFCGNRGILSGKFKYSILSIWSLFLYVRFLKLIYPAVLKLCTTSSAFLCFSWPPSPGNQVNTSSL